MVIPFTVSGTDYLGEEVTSYGLLTVLGLDELRLTLGDPGARQTVDEKREVSFDLADLVDASDAAIEIDNRRSRRERSACRSPVRVDGRDPGDLSRGHRGPLDGPVHRARADRRPAVLQLPSLPDQGHPGGTAAGAAPGSTDGFARGDPSRSTSTRCAAGSAPRGLFPSSTRSATRGPSLRSRPRVRLSL